MSLELDISQHFNEEADPYTTAVDERHIVHNQIGEGNKIPKSPLSILTEICNMNNIHIKRTMVGQTSKNVYKRIQLRNTTFYFK